MRTCRLRLFGQMECTGRMPFTASSSALKMRKSPIWEEESTPISHEVRIALSFHDRCTRSRLIASHFRQFIDRAVFRVLGSKVIATTRPIYLNVHIARNVREIGSKSKCPKCRIPIINKGFSKASSAWTLASTIVVRQSVNGQCTFSVANMSQHDSLMTT